MQSCFTFIQKKKKKTKKTESPNFVIICSLKFQKINILFHTYLIIFKSTDDSYKYFLKLWFITDYFIFIKTLIIYANFYKYI